MPALSTTKLQMPGKGFTFLLISFLVCFPLQSSFGASLRGGFGIGSEATNSEYRVISLVGSGLSSPSAPAPSSNGLLLGPANRLYFGPLPFLPENLSDPFRTTGITRELAFFLGADPDNPSAVDLSSIWSRLPLLTDESGEWVFSYERFVDWADYFTLVVAYTHDLDGLWQPVPSGDIAMDPAQAGTTAATEVVTARLDPTLYPAPVYLRLELIPLESN
jgi:hypothetical protein